MQLQFWPNQHSAQPLLFSLGSHGPLLSLANLIHTERAREAAAHRGKQGVQKARLFFGIQNLVGDAHKRFEQRAAHRDCSGFRGEAKLSKVVIEVSRILCQRTTVDNAQLLGLSPQLRDAVSPLVQERDHFRAAFAEHALSEC
ncbi:hypothetical protein D3C86_1526530 [compost metagenome]